MRKARRNPRSYVPIERLNSIDIRDFLIREEFGFYGKVKKDCIVYYLLYIVVLNTQAVFTL